jgi:hypothetical protein
VIDAGRQRVLDEIHAEREAQDREFGGPRVDDAKRAPDWQSVILKHLGRAVDRPFDAARFRRQMVRVAALAVAGVEWIDRLGLVDKPKGAGRP